MNYNRVDIKSLALISKNVKKTRVLLPSCQIARPKAFLLGESDYVDMLLDMVSRPMLVPEVEEYQIKNATIIDDGIVLVDDFSLEESLADTKDGTYGDVTVSAGHVSWDGSPIPSDAKGLLLKKRGQTNYGHWLIELLPKLSIGKENTAVIITNPATGFDFLNQMYNQSIEAISPKSKIHRIPRRACQIESFTYISGVSKNGTFFHPYVAKMAAGIKRKRDLSGVQKKIFVTRPASAGRGIFNQSEVESFFSSKGFEIIEPSSLSFMDQVLMFSNATEIYGIKGAAMCNAIFSPPAAKVGYISPHYMNGKFFLNMETAMGRNSFNVLFCNSISNTRPTIKDPINVDLRLLEEFVGQVSYH